MELNTLLTLITFNLILLSVLTAVFLILLILVLVMVRRTLIKAQKAIDNVEEAAMVPLLSLKHMFSDAQGFVSSIKAWSKMIALRRKKK